MNDKKNVFIASSNDKFYELCLNLMSEDKYNISIPTDVHELREDENRLITCHDINKKDRFKIINSELVILDFDSEIKKAYLYWSCVNPNSEIIIVSDFSVLLDETCSDRVFAIIKPSYLSRVL